jgi:MFS superfamily sulfate permease-like transporter
MQSNESFFKNIKYDIPAAIVVFLVAVPLCLGIALASGVSLFSGIIAGMVGGIIVTLFSNSSLGVSGPAAGLVAIVVGAIEQLGSFEIFLLAVVIAGAFQVLLGFLRAGTIGYYFPSSVIKGMLAGIGAIIILKQIPHALGDDKDYEGDQDFIQPDGENTFTEIFHAFEDVLNPNLNLSWGPVIVALVSFAILILWQQNIIKKQKWALWVQGPLVVVITGIFLNLAFAGHEHLEIVPEHLVSLPVFDSWGSFAAEFKTPDFSAILNPEIYGVAFTLAVVASMESLLCAEATDKLDPHKRTTDLNRELKAQGIGNMVAGLIGGLPVTQVIVRSSANIQSGGRSRAAAFLHGILLLICAVSIPFVLNLIPLASLAAILIMVGLKLAKPSLFQEMWRLGWNQFLPFLVTIVAILLTDLLIGIGIGMVVALFYILRNNFRAPYIQGKEKDAAGNEVIRILLSEDVSFLNKSSIKQLLANIPEGSKVIIDASNTLHIDYDVIDIIEDFKAYAEFKHIEWQFVGLGVNDQYEHKANQLSKNAV